MGVDGLVRGRHAGESVEPEHAHIQFQKLTHGRQKNGAAAAVGAEFDDGARARVLQEWGEKVFEKKKEIQPAVPGLDRAAFGQAQGLDIERIGQDCLAQPSIFETPTAGVTVARRTEFAQSGRGEKVGIRAGFEVITHAPLSSAYPVCNADRTWRR